MNNYEFNIGSSVQCTDGGCGKLTRVVVDPETLTVTDFIVEEGLLRKQARVIPIDVVERADEDGLQLTIHSDALPNYPKFEEVEFEEVSSSDSGGVVSSGYGPIASGAPTVVVHRKQQLGIAEELETVERGTTVSNARGKVGKLDRVLTDPESGAITHLVIREGILFPDHTTVPIALVEHITEEGIFIAATDEELETLPALPGEEGGDEPRIVDTTDPGSQSLAARIETKLSIADETKDTRIEVVNDRGIVTLRGEVDSESMRAAATEIAANQPGVIQVTNELNVAS